MAPGSSATLLAISQIQPVKEINKFPNSKFIVFVHRDKLLIEMTEEYMIYQGGLHAVRDPAIILGRAQNLRSRASATPLLWWTMTPLLYSRSTDLPVLRRRLRVGGAPEWP